jgi:hypothetical protein
MVKIKFKIDYKYKHMQICFFAFLFSPLVRLVEKLVLSVSLKFRLFSPPIPLDFCQPTAFLVLALFQRCGS